MVDIRRWRRSRVVRFDARLVKVSNLMCSHLCFVVCSTLASISPRKPQFSTVISFIHPSYDHIINYYYFFVWFNQLSLHGIDLSTIIHGIDLSTIITWYRFVNNPDDD